MRTRRYRQRATDLHLAEWTHKPARMRVAAASLIAAAGLGTWLAPLLTTSLSSPLPVPSVSATEEIQWHEVVQVLDAMRNRAVEDRDLSALRLAVHPSGPAFASESAVINTLIEQDITVSNLDFHLISVAQRFRRWTGTQEYVDLEVVDERRSYEEKDGVGIVFTVAPRARQKWNVLLMRDSPQDPWRLWSVSSAT